MMCKVKKCLHYGDFVVVPIVDGVMWITSMILTKT